MNIVFLLHIFSYICLLVFVAAFTFKTIRYARMPVHLRWELYPLMSGNNSKLIYMMQEILFFAEYFKRNKAYWYFVYPFHTGIFMFVVSLVVLLFQSVVMTIHISGINELKEIFVEITGLLSLILGNGGFIVGTIGTLGLIAKRIADENLRNYTNPRDFFDLLLILAVFISGMYAYLFSGRTFSPAVAYMQSMLIFNSTISMDLSTVTYVVLLGVLIAYSPFTKMMHYLAKYFIYHKVRWDDEPNLGGSNIERKLQKVSDKTLSWSAPHIQQGRKWSEVVSEMQPPKQKT